MNITDFLLARIQEDEKRANYYGPLAMGTDRVLAECTAKREIIRWWVDGLIGYVRVDDDLTNPLLPLAAVYKDHPDYQQEWNPYRPTP